MQANYVGGGTLNFLSKLKNSISVSIFSYENQIKHPIYVSKKCFEEKHLDLLVYILCWKTCNVLIKDFNKFMYDHTLHRRKKRFCCYYVKTFSTEKNIKMLC